MNCHYSNQVLHFFGYHLFSKEKKKELSIAFPIPPSQIFYLCKPLLNLAFIMNFLKENDSQEAGKGASM
jgi:hypothetical protein